MNRIKNLFFYMTILVTTVTNAQFLKFDDPNFKKALLESKHPSQSAIDTNRDGEISKAEANRIFRIFLIDKKINKNITSLNGLEQFSNAVTLRIEGANLPTIDLRQNPKIAQIFLLDTKTKTIDVSKNVNLNRLHIFDCPLQSLDITNNKKLRELSVGHINANNYPEIDNKLRRIDLTKNTELRKLKFTSNNSLTSLSLFKNVMLTDLEIFNTRLRFLSLSQNTKIRRLELPNNQFTILNLRNLELLEELEVQGNNLLSLTLNSRLLKRLHAGNNNLRSIDLKNSINLFECRLEENRLTSLDVKSNKLLRRLYLYNNRLSALDVSKNQKLQELDIASNDISTLDVSLNINLHTLHVDNNPLFTINTQNTSLIYLGAGNCPNLRSIYAKRETIDPNRFIFFVGNTPNLEFICANNEVIPRIKSHLNGIGQTDTIVTSNCDATPEYNISGTFFYNRFNSGCNNFSKSFRGDVKITAFSVDNPQEVYSAFPSETGTYNLNIPEGEYSILPILGNPNFFEFSDNIDFNPIKIPLEIADVKNDYCIGSKGTFYDLEASIFQIDPVARPGFEVSYLIKYESKGTHSTSGTIKLNYDDDLLTFIPSFRNRPSKVEDGEITWRFFDNLLTRDGEIEFKMRLNRPIAEQGRPALNDGDILNYTVNIESGRTDANPENNTMVLNQVVRNSYDPNDKTCLEGQSLHPNNVGDYLHYMIRFENLGTASALNVRIVDNIDTTKLDIDSFEPVAGSHEFTTLITDNKKVEFQFNHINLPFDDNNNDGYVIFKIRSKKNLRLGNTIKNKASIFFDFNPAIVTNTEVVRVERKTSSSFDKNFRIYPNPTSAFLNLEIKNSDLNFQVIKILDIGGNVVSFFFGSRTLINVIPLFSGIHFLEITTDKGVFTKQFVKI